MADGLTAIPRAPLLDLIAGLSGVRTYWDGDGLDYDETYCRLSVVGYRSFAPDEIREEYDEVNDQILTTVCGTRLFTLSIRVDSYSDTEPGFEILERVRRRLRGGAARQVLEQEGIAITVLTNPVIDLDAVADNRSVWAATWDVGMAIAVNETDVQPLGGGKTATGATVTGTVTGGQTDPITVVVAAPPGTPVIP